MNVGAEPFIVTGRRPDTNTADMNTTQRIYDPAGDYRDEPTTATLFYSSDGHDHWQHVRDLEDYDLLRIDESGNVVEPEYVVVGQIEKIGF